MRGYLRTRGVLAAIAIGLAVASAGCTPKSTPPSGTSILSNGVDFNFTYLHWDAGLAVILIDEVAGGRGSSGSGSTNSPVYTMSGYAGGGGKGYQWRLEATAGKTGTLRVDGRDYDLANGAVFVLKLKDDKLQIHQLKRDMSAIPFDADRCREVLTKDEEIQELLGKKAPPKK